VVAMRALIVTAFATTSLFLGATHANARPIIVVDGTGNPGAVQHAPDIHPDDTVTTIDYPGTLLWPTYNRSVEAGKQALRDELADAPEGTLVIGYSQGARVVGDVLTEPQNEGVEGVLYSDPRETGQGIETQLPFNLPGATMSGEREPFTVPVESHCRPGDGVCDWDNGDVLGSTIGYLRYHGTYFN
jgi:hypothetical protein